MAQLTRLANIDPERTETILNTLWTSYPGLFAEVAIAAVDQEELGVADCAACLGIGEEEVMARLRAFRLRATAATTAAVEVDEGRVARLSEARVAVWEIVREFRKLGSVQRLEEAFPALGRAELAAALKYAEANPAEIEGQIARYEDMLSQRRALYPFAR